MHTPRAVLLFTLAVLMLSACTGLKQKDAGASIHDAEAVAQIEKDLEEGNTDLAILQLEPLLKENPQSAHLQALAGQAYARKSDIPNAEKHYQKALALTPDAPGLLMNYGVFLCQQKKYVDADNAFLKAIRDASNPYRDIALVNAGMCARKAGELQRAERYFNAALQVNPDSSVALYQLARLSMDVDRPEQARVFMIRYDAIAEPTPKSLLLFALIGDELGDYNLASMSADKLVELFPNSPEATSLSAGAGREYMGLPPAKSSVSSTVAVSKGKVLSSMLSQDAPAPQVSQKETVAEESRKIEAPGPESVPVATGTSDKQSGTAWIMGQPGINYTLQLSASSDRGNLLSLAKRLKLEPFGIFGFTREGKQIYALVYGSFPNSQEARQAGEALTERGYKEQPWLRSFASVQKLMQAGP
jgi:type IV pilus assembly protein PilF